MIPIGSYRPDMAESNASVARRACNVLLVRDEAGLAHTPMPGLAVAASAQALAAPPKGAQTIVNSTGNYSVVMGTANSLYRLQAGYSWSLLGAGYSLPEGDRWSYGRFGSNLFITNRVNGQMTYDVDTGGAIVAVAGAPKARYIFPAFNAMFALDCDGENQVMRNSALGNATIWDGKGAASQTFPDGEELVCGVELTGDFAVVWQRNAIRGLYRRNDGKLFDAKLLYSGRGCVNPLAMASVDARAFFVDTDGFYMIGADGSLTAIGKDKVSKTFISRLANDGLDTIEAAIDKINSRVVFRFRDQSVTSSTVFADAIAYDYELGEWSEIALQTSAIFTMASPALTLEAMDALYGPLDGINIPLDSRVFAGGEPRLAAMDANYKFGFFDGANLASVSETSSKVATVSGTVRSITPITDAQNADISVGYRDRLSDAVTWKAPIRMQRSGRAPIFARGKILTFRQEVAAGEQWSTLRGFDGFDVRSGGPQ